MRLGDDFDRLSFPAPFDAGPLVRINGRRLVLAPRERGGNGEDHARLGAEHIVRRTVGDLQIDTRRMTANLEGVPLSLSQLEFRLLNYLAHHVDRAVPASELADHLYGANEAGDSNAIEQLVVRLRRKIGTKRIETKRGFGYVLTAGDA